MTAAVALARSSDIKVDIYEAAQAFNEIGAGVVLWPRPWRVMAALGLDKDLRGLGDIPDEGTERASSVYFIGLISPVLMTELAFEFRKSDQPEGVSFYEVFTPSRLSFYRVSHENNLIKQ